MVSLLRMTAAAVTNVRCECGALASCSVRSAVLIRQFANPIQMLLLGAAGVSLVVGQRTDAMIVTLIVLLSVMLGFVNELRSERGDRGAPRSDSAPRDGST